MKNILNIIVALALVMIFFSCEEEEFTDVPDARYEYVGISTNRIDSEVFEGSGDNSSKIPVDVIFGNDVQAGRDVTVTFEIDNSSTAVLGEDFKISGATVSGNTFTVTIPSDSYLANFEIETITNFDEEDNLTLNINIVDAEGVNIGHPLDDSFSILIEDDDCAFISDDYVGVANAVAGTYEHKSEFTYNGDNNYTLTNWWGYGQDVTFDVNPAPDALSINVPTQIISIGGYPSTLTGAGIVSTCGKSMNMDFELVYGGNGKTYKVNIVYSF